MSLQVWLPMTKDLRQQGLSSITITNNGATFSSNGKLGGCYQFNGSSYIISQSLSEDMKSASFWCNLSSNTTSQVIFADYKSHLAFGIFSTYICCTCMEYNLRTCYNASLIPTNTWVHIAVVKTNSLFKLYINGELQTPNSTADSWTSNMSDVLSIGSRSNGTTCMNGKLSDFRLYDHALSQMEVKRISQGLVLHYPLNNMGFGQENFILESHKVISGGQASGITRTYENDGSMKIVASSGNGTWCSLGFAKNSNTNVGNNMTIGDTYCISCDVKVESGTALPTLFINNGNSYKQLKPVNGSIIINKWMRIYYSSTWADPGTSSYGNISLHLGFNSAIGTYYFKNFKLEKGSIPTPWSPAPSDDLATQMGLNSNIEYDTSGYCNNGTRTGTFNWTSDTPKYSVSTYMPTAATISHSRCLDNTSQEWTCAAWVKPDATGNYQNLNNFNESNRLYHGTYPLLYLNSGTNDYYNYGNLALPANQWSHIVFVFKNSTGTKLIYVNGENRTNTGGPNKTSTPKGIPDTVIIGGSFAGYMCDYREYATALSADDVKSLYQNTATIDADGTIHGAVR